VSSGTRSFPFSLKVTAHPSDKAQVLGAGNFPSGGEWEHGAVKGATLRRPVRWWMSTLATACALAVALALMAMADEITPTRQAERVQNVPAGPPVDHQGGGVALPRIGTRVPETATTVTVPAPRTRVVRRATPKAQVELAAAKQPVKKRDSTGGGVDATGSTTTTEPTTPTTGPHIQLPGPGIDDVGGHKPHTPRKPKPPRPPKHPKPPDVPDVPCISLPGLDLDDITVILPIPLCNDPSDPDGGLAPYTTVTDPTTDAPAITNPSDDESAGTAASEDALSAAVHRVLGDGPF